MPRQPDSGEAPLIDPKDFESVRVELTVSNTTTRTELRKDAEPQLVQLLEDTQVVLDLPVRSCSKGHHLSIEFVIRRPGRKKPSKLECTAKVDGIEHETPDRDRVTVSLFQYEEQEWQDFRASFSDRQSEIEAFFAAIRGY